MADVSLDETLQALKNMVYYGDLDELPVDQDIADALNREENPEYRREIKMRGLVGALLDLLLARKTLPIELGRGEDEETLRQWVREHQDDHAPHAYSIIFGVECPKDDSLRRYLPEPRILRKLKKTEGNEQAGDVFEGGKHGKYCGVLKHEDFVEFCRQTDLTAESTETMGSIGAPGFGFGWAPAISFRAENDVWVSAYVTPLPEEEEPREITEEEWKTLREWVIRRFK